jgi:hypothetical protein
MLMLIRDNIPHFPPLHINDDQYEFPGQFLLVSGGTKNLLFPS